MSEMLSAFEPLLWQPAPKKARRWKTPRQMAEELGEKYYFTGKLCPHGHIAVRFVSGGNCTECLHLQSVQRYKENPNVMKEFIAGKCAVEPDWERQAKRNWIINNPDKRVVHLLTSRLRRRDKRILECRLWKIANKAHVSDYNRRYQAAHMSQKLARYHRRRSALLGSCRHFTVADIERIYKEQRGRCAYCRVALNHKFHRDHIVPLCLGGSNASSNIQLTCRGCNQRKHSKRPEAFARVMGLLI